jgi:AbrB family looped-hinge helix DNA binding protein
MPEIRMNLIKLGKKGQVSIPQAVLRELGLVPDSPLLVETTDDGAIVLRQVSVHPIEIYSDERLAEFERENELTPEHLARYGPQLADFSGWLRAQVKRKRPAAPSPAGGKARRAVRD